MIKLGDVARRRNASFAMMLIVVIVQLLVVEAVNDFAILLLVYQSL